MNRDDIIRMAREASNTPIDHHATPELFGANQLERFAALVAATEREECARVCEARFMGDLNREDMEARRCAAAIRARGEQS